MNFESFEDIKVLMDNFDPAALLPDLSTMFGWIELGCRVAVVIGPILLTVQSERRPPSAPAMNGQAALIIAFSISGRSRFSFILLFPCLVV